MRTTIQAYNEDGQGSAAKVIGHALIKNMTKAADPVTAASTRSWTTAASFDVPN